MTLQHVAQNEPAHNQNSAPSADLLGAENGFLRRRENNFAGATKQTPARPDLTHLEPNEEMAYDYLTALDGGAKEFNFQTFDDWKLAPKAQKRRPESFRGAYLPTEEDTLTAEKLRHANQRGSGVYVAFNEMSGGQRGNDKIERFRGCFAEFDEGNIVILFNACQKKSQKTPSEEIKLAIKLQKEYFSTKLEKQKIELTTLKNLKPKKNDKK